MLAECLVLSLARNKCPTDVSSGDDDGAGNSDVALDPNKR